MILTMTMNDWENFQDFAVQDDQARSFLTFIEENGTEPIFVNEEGETKVKIEINI